MSDGTGITRAGSRRGRVPWADIAVLGVAVVWGASYPVAKGALAFAPVLVLILYRFAVTTAVMGAASWRDLASAKRSDLVRAASLGGILFSIFMAETYGVQGTSATNTAFIISLCTLITPALQFGLARRPPPTPVLLGGALSCAGTAVLSGGLTAFNRGDALVLCAAFLRACMVISTERLMRGRALSSAALTAVQAPVVLALTGLVRLIGPGTAAVMTRADPAFWFAVAFLSLSCTVAAFYVQNLAVRRTSPTRVAFLMGTEPLFGFVLANLLLAEPLSRAGILGGGMILALTTRLLPRPALPAPHASERHTRRLNPKGDGFGADRDHVESPDRVKMPVRTTG